MVFLIFKIEKKTWNSYCIIISNLYKYIIIILKYLIYNFNMKYLSIIYFINYFKIIK